MGFLRSTFRFCGLVAALLCLAGVAAAAEVVLKDGTVLRGEIQTLRDGVYTVKTSALGTVRVRKADVRSIQHGTTSASKASASRAESGDLQSLQSRIMGNPDLASLITALQSDPEVQAALADPEIVEAMMSGNYAALMAHPKIIALTRNAKMREVIEEVR